MQADTVDPRPLLAVKLPIPVFFTLICTIAGVVLGFLFSVTPALWTVFGVCVGFGLDIALRRPHW
jgi:hypothetical protein